MENKQQSKLENLFNDIENFKGIGREAKLVRDIVPIETWLNEEFYSGPSSRQIYPYWKKAIIEVFSSPVRINEVILGGSIGTGKGLLNSQSIPTPMGDKQIGDLKVGDYIFGKSGKPVKVIGVFPQGTRPIYKVSFKDGSYLICDDQHLWTLEHTLVKERTMTLSTEEMYNTIKNDLTKKGAFIDWEIPIAKALEYPKKEYKIEPYLLGSLLSGCNFKKDNFSYRCYMPDVIEYISSKIIVENKSRFNNYKIDLEYNPLLVKYLEELNLLDIKETDLFIPNEYLIGSIQDRLELLYGLMDGAGTRRKSATSTFMYSTKSITLANNIVRLITSLSGLARIHINNDKRLKNPLYEVYIDINFNPFKYSTYKKVFAAYMAGRRQRTLTRRMNTIEYIGEENTTCIKVDSEDELFIADINYNIVTHNTTIACYMIAYRLYELSCYYPPQALYNLMNNSKILFAYFNINKELAGQVGFAQIRDLIDTIPYFQNIFKRNERINSILEWPQSHIYMKSASSSNDVIGMNLISFFVDEANFFKGDGVSTKGTSINDVQSKARTLYNSVRTRGKSRFVVNNEDFTFNVLVSSSMYDSSFTAERIEASTDDPHVKVYEPKIWEVKNADTYSKERFVVFSGNELIDPMICNNVADINYIRTHYRLPEVKCDTPNKAIKDIKDYDIKKRFIEVPINFRQEFEGNIIQALQDIAGVPVAATGRLFSNRDCYAKALIDEESPFTQDQIIISTNANTTIQDYFKKDWRPSDINKKRFIHFDQATSGDSYGVAQCYIDSVVYDDYGLPKVNIKIDWMIRINPPKAPNKIDLAKVRSIIPWQEKNFGISYGTISYDTFQSAEAVQDLSKSGYPVQFRSVDRSDKEYLDLTELYYQGRIKHYRNEWYEKELFNLNWYRAKGKVDHPPVRDGGTKDVADAVCGSVANALEYPAVEEVQRENDISWFLDGSSNGGTTYLDDRNELLNGFGNIY